MIKNILRKINLALRHPKTAYKFFLKDFWKKEKYYLFDFPVQITFFLTEKCNLKCPMCHVRDSREKILEKKSLPDLDILLLEKVFNECKDFGSAIQLVGGEPLLYPKLFQLLELAKKNNLICSITTNGVLLKKYSKDIIDSGLEFLAVSLDSGDSSVHDVIRGVPGTFDRVIEGVDSILSLRGKSLFPRIHLRTVISKDSLETFDNVLSIAGKMGIDDWSASQFFFYPERLKNVVNSFADECGAGKEIWGMPIAEENYFNDEQIRKLESKLEQLKNKFKNSKIGCNIQKVGNLKKYYQGKPLAKNSFCNSPFWQIFIRQNGDIELCQGYIIGNIKETSVYEVWHSDKAKHFRSLIEKNRITPACFRCCAMEKFQFE